jgi:hypothetical protein
METLFDPDKPYFAAWIGIHDIDKLNEANLIIRQARFSTAATATATATVTAATMPLSTAMPSPLSCPCRGHQQPCHRHRQALIRGQALIPRFPGLRI